ncbi:MAG: dTMP kinase, partial [bacterium]|nr:dTMP kinase [bacterium]
LRHGDKDRLENEDISFHRNVRRGFLRLAAEDAGRYRVIDASRPVEDVFTSLFTAVMDYLRHSGWQA